MAASQKTPLRKIAPLSGAITLPKLHSISADDRRIADVELHTDYTSDQVMLRLDKAQQKALRSWSVATRATHGITTQAVPKRSGRGETICKFGCGMVRTPSGVCGCLSSNY